MCVPFLTKILCSTLMYDDSSRRYTVYNLERAVTILNSTSKGQDNARESAYLLKNHVWRDKVAFSGGEREMVMSLAKYC